MCISCLFEPFSCALVDQGTDKSEFASISAEMAYATMKGPALIEGDNQFVLVTSTIGEKSASIVYHYMHAAATRGE